MAEYEEIGFLHGLLPPIASDFCGPPFACAGTSVEAYLSLCIVRIWNRYVSLCRWGTYIEYAEKEMLTGD